MGLDIVVSMKHFSGESIRKPVLRTPGSEDLMFPLDFWLPDAMSWTVMPQQSQLVRCAHRQVGHGH